MAALGEIAPAFVAMAHQIVWASVATVDRQGRPRSRVLHPIWEWDGANLVGWIATGPTPVKRAHLAQTPNVSVNYWAANHDTCLAECHAEWQFDLDTRREVWEKFKTAPAPVGYDPAIIPAWTSPEADSFAALRLEPYRLRVMPGSVMLQGAGQVLSWASSTP
ncbi:MAG: pyridoxamine 5'-phosphate oxidase family protein [Chloroflexi bacterium]|nr:pyridoxamine 5'-phosphate oxidase family protein [Chloroflexota bacterium]MDA1148069.1 pyridoxamine 5'-phosphate oxidase family protein [Chloroflexota bacterium]